MRSILRKIHHQINRTARLLQNRSLILVYHRIADLVPDPQLLCVTPSHFREHLEQIKTHYQSISLQELLKGLFDGNVPNKGVVITFDDGYVDNLWNAKPLLEKYKVPATVFVTSGFVGHDRELTSDVLERCLLQPEKLPDFLNLKIDGKEYSWSIDNYREDAKGWNVTMDTNPTRRHVCYRDLHRILRPMTGQQRQDVLNELSRWASIPAEARADRRIVNREEIKKLAEGGLVEIGSHGSFHLLLEAQPSEQQRKDIVTSKHDLEAILGQNVNSFAYPFGISSDLGSLTVNLVKETGFAAACANFAAPVARNSDLFLLPRFLVRNWSGEEFGKRLKKAFAG